MSTNLVMFVVYLSSVIKTTFGQNNLNLGGISFGLTDILSGPRITKQSPNDELIFILKASTDDEEVLAPPLILPCEAKGGLALKYTWTKNEQEFNWEAYKPRIFQLKRSGTLNITSPQAEDIGRYQCTVSDDWDKSIANLVHVRGIELEYFNETEKTTVTAVEGQPFVFKCNVSVDYVKSDVVWIRKDFMKPVRSIQQLNSYRLTVDPEGSLWFSHVTGTDASSVANEEYVCVARARYQAKWHFVERIFLEVSITEAFNKPQPPILQYASQRNTAVMQSSDLVLWCVFGGIPTPEISWKKMETPITSQGIGYRNSQRTLTIKNVELSYHDGTYVCNASNSHGWVLHSFVVSLYSPPTLLHSSTNQNNSTFLNCETAGNPTPMYTWTYNGKRMEEETKKTLLITENPKSTDGTTTTYSCNASNVFGHVHKEFTIKDSRHVAKITTSQSEVIATIGDTVYLTCTFDYIRYPASIKWTKNNQEFSPEKNTNSYKLHKAGGKISLQILNVNFSHAGEYVSHVENSVGTFTSFCSVTLIVLPERGYLTIVDKPEDLTAVKGTNVTFPCLAETDRFSNFTVDWLLNSNQIDFSSKPRFRKQANNYLHISSVQRSDLGAYLCVARAGYETVNEFGVLKVMDVPMKPTISTVLCKQQSAFIVLKENENDDSDILFYQIEYSTSFTPEVWKVAGNRVPLENSSVEVALGSWKNYTFRAIAVNKMGASSPSSPTSFMCSTGPGAPDVNPRNVKLQRISGSDITVSWDSISEDEHNAPSLMYVVEWKSENDTSRNWHKINITDWKSNQTVLHSLPNSQRYRIRVRAVNEVGKSTEKAVELIGYTWIDEALPVDNNLALPISLTVLSFVIAFLGIGLLLIKRRYRRALISRAEMNSFFRGDAATEKDSAYKMPYDKEKYEINLKSFKIHKNEMLGSGEFGMVYKGEIVTDHEPTAVAVKTANPNKIHRTIVNGLLSEIKVLAHVGKHQNITELIGANTEQLKQGKVFILLEMCPFGSLEKCLRSIRAAMNTENNMQTEESYADIIEMNTFSPSTLDPKTSQDLIRWSREICDGMAFLALKRVVHADLATRNVLLGTNREAKICDFGLSRRMYNYASYVKGQQEPLPWKWMAPESLRIQEFNEKTDVWAFGVTLWEIYSLGDSPYQGLSWDLNFVQILQRGFRLGEPEFNERDMYSVMKRCWNFNPDHRPSFATLVAELENAFSQQIIT